MSPHTEVRTEEPAIVIYISGYGRSGSSALGRDLASALDCPSLGEAWRINSAKPELLKCRCGEKITLCRFWSPRLVFSDNGMVSAQRTLIGIVKSGDFRYVVDSTKTAYLDAIRPVIYTLNSVKVYNLHLLRDPKQVLESARKGTNRDLEAGIHRQRPMTALRTLIGWSIANLLALACRAISTRNAVIQFSDFENSPEDAVKNALADLNIVRPGGHERLRNDRRAPPGHEIAGNRALQRVENINSGSTPQRPSQETFEESVGLRLVLNLLCAIFSVKR
jgi:hypothetical protein